MVRIVAKIPQNDDVNIFEYSGLSTDTKPVHNIGTGSLFLEVDTGAIYAFNESGTSVSEWAKIAELGGGS